MRHALVPLLAAASLVSPAAARAHAELSPSIVLSGRSQVFTLVVPTERAEAATTKVELAPPADFEIESFLPSPGWKRDVRQAGSGADAPVARVTWEGGRVAAGDAAAFSFLGGAQSAKTYTFSVRQTYSDGSVVDWSGPEDSDTPAPTLEAKDSFGDGGTSVWSVVALIVGALALVVALAALVAGAGKRPLA